MCHCITYTTWKWLYLDSMVPKRYTGYQIKFTIDYVWSHDIHIFKYGSLEQYRLFLLGHLDGTRRCRHENPPFLNRFGVFFHSRMLLGYLNSRICPNEKLLAMMLFIYHLNSYIFPVILIKSFFLS